MFHAVVGKSVTSISGIVGVENNFVTTGGYQESVVGERLLWIEIENKYQILTHIGEYLVAVVVPDFLYGSVMEVFNALDDLQHGSFEVTQVVVGQVLVVHQVPLSTGILARPSVAFAWEVYPFGMAELVAHEVEVTSIDGSGCQQADHLVECDTALYGVVFIAFLEVPVHVGIDKAEDDGLVAYECLVV